MLVSQHPEHTTQRKEDNRGEMERQAKRNRRSFSAGIAPEKHGKANAEIGCHTADVCRPYAAAGNPGRRRVRMPMVKLRRSTRTPRLPTLR